MFGLLFLLAASQATDPLAEARAGKQQCVSPKVETKKCLAIASYTPQGDASFEAVVTLMIAPNPVITMETRSVVTVEGDLVCGPVRKADYEKAKFTVDGKPADEATASAISTQVLATVATMEGKKACSKDRPEGPIIVEEVTLDGVAQPAMTQRFIWIRPTDGYTLGQ